MAQQRRSKVSNKSSWWAALNSRLAIALLAGTAAVIGAGGKEIYSHWEEAAKDRAARKTNLAALMVEYRQRLSALEEADSELGLPEFKEGMSAAGMHKLSDAERKVFEIKADSVGKREWDIMRGSGHYVATTPTYSHVNLQIIAAQIDDSAGIPAVQSGALEMMGILNIQPSALWLFVHAMLPQMRTFYVGRWMMLLDGQLPLERGAQLSPRQERVLGIVRPKPGELEKLEKESDALNERIQRELGGAANEQ